jgi:hypothetical protein
MKHSHFLTVSFIVLLVSMMFVPFFQFGFVPTVKSQEPKQKTIGNPIIWQDSSFEPKLLIDYPSVGYLTWNTTFGLYTMDKARYLMSLTDRAGILQVSKSMFWLNTSDTDKVLNPDKISSNYQTLVQNNTCFKVRYAVTTDKDVVGWLTVEYDFFKDSSPKISVSYENISLTQFNIVWVLLPTLKYLEVSGSTSVDYTATNTVKSSVTKEDKQCRVGETSTPMNWTSWLSVLWDDSEGVSTLYAGVEKVFGGKGLTVVFPANMVLIDPTVAFTTVSVTSIHTCPLDTHTFVIAYSDDTNDDFSFQIWDTNGTQVLAETDVDTTSGGSIGYTSIGVSAFNSTTFVIGWVDFASPPGGTGFAVYNTTGSLLSGPTVVDTTVSYGYSVQVSCFNSTYFVIGWFDGFDLDATFAVYDSSSNLKAGPTDADTDVGAAYSVSVSAFNSTTFVIGWFDEADDDATFAIYNSAGTQIGTDVDVDASAGTKSCSVSVSTLNSTYFVIGWYSYNVDDITFAVYDSSRNLKTGPTDADITALNSYSAQVAALNSTAFVITWYDGNDYDLSFATYLSDGTAVAALTDIESWPTATNAPFKYQSPCSQETANNIKIYGDNWIIAYANTTTQAIWKAFTPTGAAWDGTIPSAGNTAPTNDACDSDAAFNVGADGWVNMTVSDANLVADFNTVSILVTTSDAKTIRLNWTQATNTFSEVTDASGICTLSGSSTRVNIDADTDKIAFYFAISAGAQKGACDVTTQTIDDAGDSDSDNYASEFTINAYSSFTVLAGNTTHTWNAAPNTNDNLLDQGAIYFKVTTNFAFDIQAKANQTTLNGTAGSIDIDNVTIHKDTLASSIPLTTDYADVGGLTGHAMGIDVELSVKVWLDVPNGTPAGNYSYSLSIQVIES